MIVLIAAGLARLVIFLLALVACGVASAMAITAQERCRYGVQELRVRGGFGARDVDATEWVEVQPLKRRGNRRQRRAWAKGESAE